LTDTTKTIRNSLFHIEWTTLPVQETTSPPGTDTSWAVLAGPEDDAFGTSLLSALTDSTGHKAGRFKDLDSLLTALTEGQPAPGMVLATCPPTTTDTSPTHTEIRHVTSHILRLLQHWLTDERLTDTQLVILTHLTTTNEPHLALRNATPYTPRLTRTTAQPTLTPPAHTDWQIERTGNDTLESLHLVPHPDAHRPLNPGEVRITVHAAGLNFRDVVMALGMVPDDGHPALGEGAGIITETAPDITHLHPGDRVMGLFGIGSTAITDHRMITPIPHHWTYTQAAGTPVVFLTAYYGLTHLAHAQPGETLLVHSAAGGVGQATLQLAHHLNLTTYATAHPSKWDTLRQHDIPDTHIASTRTLDFETKFRTATHGNGVDIVLNSLAHEYTDASLRLMPHGGHFLEMGKTDLRDPHTITTTHPGVTYQAYNL
ncbi:zinc-binding dehydrogenase, partial [Streptomyces sp. NRRL F-5126]|uniref:zinc-binding dehydrogenase n=1 Tax=Streptomyces sp. NRRL F-5126 TaxID=1463857 RepID=UPI0004CC4389